MGNPWRTITHAVNMLPYDEIPNGPEAYEAGLPVGWADDPPGSLAVNNDRIVVMQTGTNNWFGAGDDGNAVAEHIYVDEPVLITADPANVNDANYFKVDITGQTDPQVIEVVASDVTIDRLFLTGAPVGVYAHPDQDPYIENVEVLNSVIKVDQFIEGTGIEMDMVKYPDIVNNHIYVGVEAGGDTLSVENAWGIYLWNCFQSTVTSNMLDIHGDPMATGIYMELCPKSLVQYNTMNVLAAGDPMSIGIKAVCSDLIQILDNTLDRIETNAGANSLALAFGIKVFNSNRAEVLRNMVTVQNNGVSDPCGLMLGMGIWLWGANESDVMDNTVSVTGVGGFNGNVVALDLNTILGEDDLMDLDQIASLMDAAIQSPSFTAGAAAVIGIKVADSYLVEVSNNNVDVKLAVNFVTGDVEGAMAVGAGLAMGIFGFDADKIMVADNTVMVDKADAANLPQPRPDVMVFVKVHAVESLVAEFSGGLGIAAALGIALMDCDLGMVCFNDVQAHATEYADIQAVPSPGDIVPLAEGSAMDRVSSELMQAVYQSFTETIGSDDISAEVSGDLPSIESFGAAGGLAAGIGILAVCSDGVMIQENMPVVGTGDMMGNTWSIEAMEQEDAVAMMGGLGLGIGIAAIDSMSPQVIGNTDVLGDGMADLGIGAQHGEPVLIADAEAFGGGAGVGFGILIVGTMGYRADAGELTGEALEALEVAPESGLWYGHAVVMHNHAMAMGNADEICVKAEDQVPDHLAIAMGKGLGLAGGIVAVWSPCIVIEQNWVGAQAYAKVCVDAEAVDSFDPLSMGGAAGIGIGIASVGSWRSQILDNEAMGEGTAEGWVMAIETPEIQSPAIGFGGSIGIGKGILVFCSGGSLVKSNGLDDANDQDNNISNAVVTGLGYAKTMVEAVNTVPLDSAIALALASGIGEGIAVVDSPCTDVIECNTAAGEGRAEVCSMADADFDYAHKLGVSVSVDILMKLWPGNHDLDEVTFEGRGGPHFGRVNYNSMVDATPLGENGAYKIIVMDAGLLKIGWPKLDAKFNWWNDPTGPTGFGPGTGSGEAVYWVGKSVYYEPWLYAVHTDVLYEQLGKFGFSVKLCKGVNTISTPIALEESVVPSRQWQHIEANSGLTGGWKYLIKWDEVNQEWNPVAPTDTFDPLEAWYIYLYDGWDCSSLILMVNSDDGHEYTMPTRNLAPGWNLIGPNPIFPAGSMPVDDALSSIVQTPAGLPGFSQVVSPVVRCQNAWYYVPGSKFAPDMESGRGYWVWMENPDVLVGFGFSPLPDQLSKIYGYWGW
jgi:hypothetical protein